MRQQLCTRSRTESLADVSARLLPYWYDAIVPDLRAGRTVLVTAHGNSLRALVAHLDRLSPAEILGLIRGAVDTYGQTTVMVTHDPKAATIADRVLFLADGLIVRELGRSSQSEILDVLSAVGR